MLWFSLVILPSQVRVVAQDGGSPGLIDTTVLIVNVNRNNYAPIFDTTSYQQILLETQSLAVPITKVTARDDDTKVSS